MSLPISAISLPSAIAIPASSSSPSAAPDMSFQSMLKNAVNNVEASSAKADAAVAGYLSGGNDELHSTILATQSADLNFEMFMQVRNKVVSAYEEIMRMQV
jgi:flagellar hook-basal body complex protein FliE